MTQSVVQAAAKGRELTEKQTALLENVRKGMMPIEAGKAAGYAETSVYQAVRSLKDEIIELAEMELVTAAPLAARTLKKIIESEKPILQANIKATTSNSVLDRVGLGKRDSLKVEHEVSGGIFIMPSKAPLPEKVINE